MDQPRRPRRLAGLPPDDYLVTAWQADQALARKIAAEVRRPVPAYDRTRDVGPTEAWRQHLADTDPEWGSVEGAAA